MLALFGQISRRTQLVDVLCYLSTIEDEHRMTFQSFTPGFRAVEIALLLVQKALSLIQRQNKEYQAVGPIVRTFVPYLIIITKFAFMIFV